MKLACLIKDFQGIVLPEGIAYKHYVFRKITPPGLCVVPLKHNDKHQVGTVIPNGDSIGINFSPENSDNGSMYYFALFMISHII